MLEVEMKFPVSHAEQLQERLRTLGTRPATSSPAAEWDHYFNAPDRDFANTDEALRLRCYAGTNRTVLTYKGPKLDAETKTRAEIEVPLADGPEPARQAQAFLKSLGYRLVASFRKSRTKYQFETGGFPVEISVDEVPDLGIYVELEIMAPDEQVDAARQAVMELAAKLGLSGCERRSYLELWLQKHGKEKASAS